MCQALQQQAADLSQVRLTAGDAVVKCSARYFATSANSRACSIGVYAAVAPWARHSIRNGSSDCRRQDNMS